MDKYVIFVICTALHLSAVAPDVTNPRSSKQYRSDYVYNHETDAFYKLHIEERRYWRTSRVCKIEGAELMSPDSEHDIIQLHSMFKKFPDLGQYVWVAADGKEHESAEEQPLIDLESTIGHDVYWRPPARPSMSYDCDVVDRNGVIQTAPCFRQYPFICKVKAADAPYDTQCGVYGTGYKYFESTGSCYKIPRVPYTWSEAYSECEAEGSHLVVINSVLEHDVVQNLTITEEPVDAPTSWFFFAGFRADRPPKNTTTTAPPRVFKTIFNQTLEQAGYSLWTDGEPNNIKGSEYCGTFFKNDGKFNDVNCDHEYPFICEKEVKRSS